ncbi:nucleotidyltransferase domain-containing protein [archaeon]|jgi:predicted nucleotidyltransferase/uncharacterized protein (UPF0332 family)|nr:nucleotidyltransferase domain-containing protein [archaeon]MBT6697934.1 nucleotidyltransferase domain-containing protein [archaeon]
MKFRMAAKDDDRLQRIPTDDLRIARKFATALEKEFQDFLVGVVVFGSHAKGKAGAHSDIDVLVIGNDMDFKMTGSFMEAYRLIIEKLIVKISPKLHVTSMTLSSFWEYAKVGDPIVTNMLRDGVALYDTGSFKPLQHLLKQGRIKPTDEAVWRYYSRAPSTLANSRWHVMQATLDLYWAVIDSAHAALMSANVIPPSPDHVGEYLHKTFVKKRELEEHYVDTMNSFYKLNKDIVHRKLEKVTGPQYEKLHTEAGKFVARMKRIIYKYHK